MILSSKRYQKGNLMSHLRPSRFAAPPPNAADILAGVTQLHVL
jgi:hypothetical protein